jgi:hypothetical protein
MATDHLTVDPEISGQKYTLISLLNDERGVCIGIKVRGTYTRDVDSAARSIQMRDPHHSIYVMKTGYWTGLSGIDQSALNTAAAAAAAAAVGAAGAAPVVPAAAVGAAAGTGTGTAPVVLAVPSVRNRYKTHLVQYLDLSKLDSCTVCLDTIRDVSVLPCLHMFCKECVDPVSTCPICRAPI